MATEYRVTHLIEAETVNGKGTGLVAFTRDCPAVFSEKHGYRVVSRTTEPVLPPEHYMQPSLDRQRHVEQGTATDKRVVYTVPETCRRWLDRFLERQGYTAIEDGEVLRVVTTAEAVAHDVANLKALVAAMEVDGEDDEVPR